MWWVAPMPTLALQLLLCLPRLPRPSIGDVHHVQVPDVLLST